MSGKKSKNDIIDLGYQAFHRGEALSENPYFEDTDEADWWLLGWQDGEEGR